MNDQEIFQGLVYADNLAVAWQPVEAMPDTSRLALISESNETFLRSLSAFAEFIKEPAEESSELMQELARLDLKLNLLLELVGQIVYRQTEIPGFAPVKLFSRGVEWRADDVPQPGQSVMLRLYVQRGIPKPLCFYGDVVSTLEEKDQGVAKVIFHGLSQSVVDWLEKFIFRQHRRSVAHSKSSL